MGCRAVFSAVLAVALAGALPSLSNAEPPAAADFKLNVPPGFSIERVAGPPLVERPIVASFDDEGRLYVAESSGSNDPVQKQLEERPHRIIRLDDTDGDGKFDKRTVFADRMMFPEGVMWLDGSVYVSAPPSIWKLTDTDGDGVADKRTEWFRGKTLTGCANDLHGPYAGPDGWIYWCKGAFAEQTHEVNGKPWTTKAAHIFRCRPDGSGFEPVLTGGMDNPVDVTFTPEGERLLSATYLVGEGRRDGLVHVIYGGVYGKDHGVLDGHPRTGELMPALVLMSPAAPCGMECYDSDSFGAEYRDNLFVSQFNLRKVSRHVLKPAGSTFATEDSDFVWSDFVDFHPTDVVVDADGSLLVIDTGGWYKLCCPTSQLWKPDVLGGIYRVRHEGIKRPADPRGHRLGIGSFTMRQLWASLADGRPAVRQRASREFAKESNAEKRNEFLVELNDQGAADAIGPLPEFIYGGISDARTRALARVWALGRIESDDAKSCVRDVLNVDDDAVRHAALCLVSLHRDKDAYAKLIETLAGDTPANRRVAAEALGRIGNRAAIPALLAAAAEAGDRVLQHSIIYALIELDDPQATRAGLTSKKPGTQAAAIVALDQMPGGSIDADTVVPLLNSPDATLRDDARWLVSRHAEWGGKLAGWFGQQLKQVEAAPRGDNKQVAAEGLEQILADFAADAAVAELVGQAIARTDTRRAAKALALRVIARAKLRTPPAAWRAAVANVVASGDGELLPSAIEAARELPRAKSPNDKLNASLHSLSKSTDAPREVRVAALGVVAACLPGLEKKEFDLLLGALSDDTPVPLRSAAVDALAGAPLDKSQLAKLCSSMEHVGPLEMNRLVPAFSRSADDGIGTQLLAALNKASARSSLRIDLLRESLAKYGPSVQKGISDLESLLNVNAAAQRKRIAELLPKMASGDVRRGHAVFYSAKATCSSCHRMGYAGGTVGPELSEIGKARTERDLLESILYPSLSFVRSYEPVQIVTTDGRTLNGRIRDETYEEVFLATGPDQEVRLARDEIESTEPSTVSVMPSGLDGQLSVRELADLVAFLKNPTGQ